MLLLPNVLVFSINCTVVWIPISAADAKERVAAISALLLSTVTIRETHHFTFHQNRHFSRRYGHITIAQRAVRNWPSTSSGTARCQLKFLCVKRIIIVINSVMLRRALCQGDSCNVGDCYPNEKHSCNYFQRCRRALHTKAEMLILIPQFV